MISGKIWGTTQCLFRSDTVEVHRIDVRAGGYSSEHQHAAKSNLFFVESGMLKVTVYRGEDLRDETVLGPGQSTSVLPGEWHKFEALAPTIAYEIYHVVCVHDDIRRRTQGGIADGSFRRKMRPAT